MKRNILIVAAAATFLLPSLALASDNVGGCGWGSKLFDGQKGVPPQVLAATTNGSSGNQTFGISSGTSGCTQNGVVNSEWKTAAFIDANMNRLALDMSRGQGESLNSLGSLIGVSPADQVAFNSTLQSNFTQVFSSSTTSSTDVAAGLKNVLAADEQLAKYSANV